MVDIRTTEEILCGHPKWSYIRTDRNGTRYFSDCTCRRCGGHGFIQCYGHVEGGRCFECGGSGITDHPETIKVYTPEHDAKLAAQRQARADARIEAKRKEYREHMSDKLRELGFGIEEGIAVCYRVVGNTYEVKEQLKALGCKFKPQLGWYSAQDLEGFETQRLEAAEVCHFDEEAITIEWEDAEQVKQKWTENIRKAEESTSRHVGNIGERIEINVHIDRVFESEFRVHGGEWGSRSSYMYLMHDAEGNIYKWSSSCYYVEGEDVKLRATVKDHIEYRGVAQTVITRGTKVK